jgi:hypothetical protein
MQKSKWHRHCRHQEQQRPQVQQRQEEGKVPLLPPQQELQVVQ